MIYFTLIGLLALLLGAVVSIGYLISSLGVRDNPANYIIALVAIGLFCMVIFFMDELANIKKMCSSPIEREIKALEQRMYQPDHFITDHEQEDLQKKISDLQALL